MDDAVLQALSLLAKRMRPMPSHEPAPPPQPEPSLTDRALRFFLERLPDMPTGIEMPPEPGSHPAPAPSWGERLTGVRVPPPPEYSR